MPAAKNRPDFLVIGAMKCGTTTLYHDLLSHPDIFLPDKESNLLFNASPSDAFAEAYKKSTSAQLCGEVCPDYSKLPDLSDAIPNTKSLFTDSSPRIIYLVREPLSRTLSHHRFVSSRRDTRFPTMAPDINLCLSDHPELINYSRYAMQIRPWIDAFGEKSILILRFEDFIKSRNNTLKEIFTFLGVSTDHFSAQQNQIHNRSDSRPVLTPGWQRFIGTDFYLRFLRPLLSLTLRDKIRALVLPKPSSDYTPPTTQTRQDIIDPLREDVIELQQIMDLDSPPWDLDNIKKP